MRPRSRFSQRVLGPILLCVSLFGCANTDFFSPRRFRAQDDAGAVHFAVLSISPWEAYRDVLQPHFDLTPERALSLVLPATQGEDDSRVERTSVAVEATAQVKGKDDEVLPTGAPGQSYGGGGGGNGGPPLLSAPTPDVPVPLRRDPMLEYTAATALYQEVQMLNRYVQDAAVRRGMRPYAVRLQISLMPFARDEPYDAYTTISFFSGGGGAPILNPRGSDLASASTTPQVIPLLATDNLEAVLRSRSLEQSTRKSFAASASAPQPGVNASGTLRAQDFDAELQNVIGQDLNSLLTVGRVSDNSIRVRLGALRQPTAGYAMVPRTHNVTVLLMVPDSAPTTVRAVSHTTFTHAESGRELAERSNMEIERRLGRVARRHRLGLDGKELRQLFAHAQANNQDAFASTYAQMVDASRRNAVSWNQVWLDLVSLMIGSRYGATEIDLP